MILTTASQDTIIAISFAYTSGFHHLGSREVTCNVYYIGPRQNYSWEGSRRNEPVVSTHSICSVKDRFERKKGRKLALARALTSERLALTKQERRELWQSYFSKTSELVDKTAIAS